MKKSILLSFLFLNLFCSAQNKYNNATYSIELNKKLDYNDESLYDAMIKDVKSKLKSITFNLDFNDTVSHFSFNKNTLSEDDKYAILIIADMAGDEYWNTKTSDTVFTKNQKFKFVKDKICYSIIKTEWIITDETKTINGFYCKKAYSTLEKDYGDGTPIRTYDLTAWFCPDIEYGFGPKFFKGLPGLIVELEQNLVLFKLLNVDYKESKNIIIPKENSISESSIYDMLESTMPK